MLGRIHLNHTDRCCICFGFKYQCVSPKKAITLALGNLLKMGGRIGVGLTNK